jgi:hypothetical protein
VAQVDIRPDSVLESVSMTRFFFFAFFFYPSQLADGTG